MVIGYLLALLCVGWQHVLGKDLKEKPNQIGPRVIGGVVTTNAKLGGYMMVLKYKKEFMCGGTLIHELIVLTAAHCFIGMPKPEYWTVTGGVSRRGLDKGEVRQVKSFLRPNNFDQTNMHMDVALMRLAKPMKGLNIAKIPLCTGPLEAGTIVTVSGWGLKQPENVKPEKLLRRVEVPIIDKKSCSDAHLPTVKLTSTVLCAGVLGRRDACTFDSGGPLVYQGHVCGIVSFGIGCASRRYPGVYTDVNHVKPFIKESMQKLLNS
ncbi:seminase-like [Drosophila bipectinata]|uniref:seminase-like n=1 Tax=Drosophila bipectinata TaxID=42026 RepID=UPI001C8AE494|nr:seminase-like [Drosophila bipectinata]